MHRYEVTMSVVVKSDNEHDAWWRAVNGRWDPAESIVEENRIRILPDPIPYVLTNKGEAALKEHE